MTYRYKTLEDGTVVPYPIDTQLPSKNQRILLTGGAGFLGRHVHKELLSRNYHYVFVPRSKEYDLTNFEATKKLIEWYKPDIVVHLAAEVGGIGANMKSPGRFFYANMSMGLNLIECARIFGISKFVQIGTVCSYPKFCPTPFSEKDLWNGYPEETNAPYGIAKKALYTMLDAYYKQYNLKSCVIIPTNLYGPYDNFDPESSHVIPALIKKFVDAKNNKDKYVTCWGDGSATREFIHAQDAAIGIVNGMELIDNPDPINLGSGDEISMFLLANTIKEITKFDGEILWDTSKPEGQPRRLTDITRAKKLLDWQPKTNLLHGLRETIQFYIDTYQK